MKTKISNFCAVMLSFFLMGAGCESEEEELPPNTAAGKVILVTGQCYGETVLIEVENPKGIGLPGTFSFITDPEKKITYYNGIVVPYFSKIDLSATSQTVGTWLYFEYRELTDVENENSNLYSINPPISCPTLYGPPNGKRLIVTKIIKIK